LVVVGAALLCTVALEGRPFADRQEWHLSPVGLLGAAAVTEGRQSVWTFSGGAAVRAAYGLADVFELGLQAGFTACPSLFFPHLEEGAQPGSLLSDLYTVDLTLDARLVLGVSVARAFARVHPFIGARAGGMLRILTSQALIDDQHLLVLRPGDTVDVLPTVTGYLGTEYRFARAWALGLIGAFTYGGDGYYSALGGLEITYLTYGVTP
jgi:hypothetical protein